MITSNPRAFVEPIVKNTISQWRTLYRHHGVFSLLRCLSGTVSIFANTKHLNSTVANVDCVTFSVIPGMTALWSLFFERANRSCGKNIWIGDCSGGFRPLKNSIARTIPIFNYGHGFKLDLFMERICQAEYVVISDDDIFWLNELPLQWALSQFFSDEHVAVVSLHPRLHNTSWLEHVVSQPMGSYCLVIRRKIWLQEKISFEIVKPDGWRAVGNYFDTADYANLQLVKQGYRVICAPIEIQANLIPFYGMSMWGLRIQMSHGNIQDIIRTSRPAEYQKAFRTALTFLGFYSLKKEFNIDGIPLLVQRSYLERAKEIAERVLDEETLQDLALEVYQKMEPLRKTLAVG